MLSKFRTAAMMCCFSSNSRHSRLVACEIDDDRDVMGFVSPVGDDYLAMSMHDLDVPQASVGPSSFAAAINGLNLERSATTMQLILLLAHTILVSGCI